MKIIHTTKNRINKNSLLLFSIIFIGSMIYINLLSSKLTNSTGMQVLDFKMFYSSKTAFDILNGFGANGRLAYLSIIKIDFLFPITYMLFGVALLSMSLKLFRKYDSNLDIVIVLPILAMLFDWVENIMIITMIIHFPTINPVLVLCTNILTILKFSLTGSTIVISIVLSVLGLVKKDKYV